MEDPRWLSPSEARAWRGWLAASELVRAQMGRDLQTDSGMSEADYTVLVYLSESVAPDSESGAGTEEAGAGGSQEHRVRMSDLAAALRWSKSRLSHQVGRMESRGLLTREGCLSDARGSFAVLTATGLREIERAAPFHVASVRQHFIDLLSTEQLTELAGISETVIEHLLSLPGAPARPAACPGAGTASETSSDTAPDTAFDTAFDTGAATGGPTREPEEGKLVG